MEPEISLPCSREPSTEPSPEPVRNNPFYLSKNPPMSWSSQWVLSFWLPTNILYAIPFIPNYATCPAHLILRDLIIINIFGEEGNLWSPPVMA
jgi:hypothetical protein